jgi:type I restriction enzyme S subunit
MTLGEIGTFLRGRRFTKADYDSDGVACIHYGEIYTAFGTSSTSVVSRVRTDLAPRLRYAQPGDVVLTDVGETVDDVGKAVAWLGDSEVAIHDHCYAFRHALDPTYVSYCMQTAAFRAQKNRHVARTKVKTLLMGGFASVSIPVPERTEQERIVGILDSFDSLVSDLAVGLPAELRARRTQYEYHRDRLLTFEEAA